MKELFLGGCIFYNKQHRKSLIQFYKNEAGEIRTVIRTVGDLS